MTIPAAAIGRSITSSVLLGRIGAGRGAAAFVAAADRALLVAVAFLLAAGAAVFWLPRHARAAPAGA